MGDIGKILDPNILVIFLYTSRSREFIRDFEDKEGVEVGNITSKFFSLFFNKSFLDSFEFIRSNLPQQFLYFDENDRNELEDRTIPIDIYLDSPIIDVPIQCLEEICYLPIKNKDLEDLKKRKHFGSNRVIFPLSTIYPGPTGHLRKVKFILNISEGGSNYKFEILSVPVKSVNIDNREVEMFKEIKTRVEGEEIVFYSFFYICKEVAKEILKRGINRVVVYDEESYEDLKKLLKENDNGGNKNEILNGGSRSEDVAVIIYDEEDLTMKKIKEIVKECKEIEPEKVALFNVDVKLRRGKTCEIIPEYNNNNLY